MPDVGNGFYIGSDYIPGWGNNELEFYTSRTNNLYVTNGLLHIVAKSEAYQGFNYTSARLNTMGLFTALYGRIEFRVKLPFGGGYWPALWLMPESSVYGTWPASGEIDVMENKGNITSTVYGTLHYGAVGNDVYDQQKYLMPNGGSVTNFHVYRIDWTTNSLTWYVDGLAYQTQTNWYSTGYSYPAPFNQPFYLIMNLSVGGNFLGNPSTNSIDINTPFPGEEQVDYVRAYNWTSAPDQTPWLGAYAINGSVVVTGTNGFPNATYNLLSSPSLAQPLESWTNMSTGCFDSNGNLTWTNTMTGTQMFYYLSCP